MPHDRRGCQGVRPDRSGVWKSPNLLFTNAYLDITERHRTSIDTNGNLSNTALQQAQVAAALTQGRINAAVAQVLAYQAVEQANRMQQAEIDRIERLAEWRDARLRTNAMADAMRAAAFQNRDRLREGLLFKIPSFYMGGQA